MQQGKSLGCGSDNADLYKSEELRTDFTVLIPSNTYKSHIDGSDLYSQDNNHSKNPVAEEMHRKLHMESERLRSRLRQELAELRERLASSVRLDSSLASVRQRLAPLTHQLQSSLRSNTDSLCGHLRHRLQGLEAADVQAEAGSSVYGEALTWMSQALQQSSAQLADILRDFQTKTTGLTEQLKDSSEGELLEEFSFRLQQRLSSVKSEAEDRAERLKTQLQAGLPVKAAASVEDFCQAASLHSQTLAGQMDSLFLGLEEDLNLPPFSQQSSGSLQEDFSQKLSALIQDILHSVQ
ncbi:apolipoprotein A-IV [Synchiropus splendidus]|uniref:apolipoprotein A-IV n=1 Tax=Synchiropus splendidus TaxID=270530 RepID=UPI00237E36A1|nr:apolipoprotein A-IV [Synchiropus splendidus]